METPPTLYTPEKTKEHLTLSEDQRGTVRAITLGIEEVDETIRSLALEDVVSTLENGHPLNRIIADKKGETIGYIACEDFVPHEAYIKFFGTTGHTGRSLLKEIPAFLEYAEQQGYTKLNFHGWNERLNHILERYGFQRIRTDNMAGFSADFFEKAIGPQRSGEDIEKERIAAFERKYINKINQEYQQTLKAFSQDNRQGKEKAIMGACTELDRRLAGTEGFEYGDRQKAILKLKLARHFQKTDSIDLNVLFDAVIESPKFIHTDKGSLHRLLEVHQEKTLQKIAELRKARAEMGDDVAFNPYEALFTTPSGKYYMARLLNMPHLEQESQYMDHCVGTSDSYVNRIKKGEIEILSFRHVPQINPKTGILEGDTPVMTIEYNLKSKVIQQMKKKDDEYLDRNDPYFSDIIDALGQLRAMPTDAGVLRDFAKISPSELENITVADHHLLTDQGEIHFRDFDPNSGVFILKTGYVEIVKGTSKKDAAKLLAIVDGIECAPEQIAIGRDEISSETKAYVGELFESIFKDFPHLESIYTSFPHDKIRVVDDFKIEEDLREKSGEELVKVMKLRGIQVGGSEFMLTQGVTKDGETYDSMRSKTPEQMTLVHVKVRDLFKDEKSHTTDEIYAEAEKFGLELCPAEVGPHYRLAYKDQPPGEYVRIAMKQITVSDGHPLVFNLHHVVVGLWLDAIGRGQASLGIPTTSSSSVSASNFGILIF